MVSDPQPTCAGPDVFVIVAAYNEADRIAATLAALGEAFPGASLWVADDGSTDGTATIAEAAGATVGAQRACDRQGWSGHARGAQGARQHGAGCGHGSGIGRGEASRRARIGSAALRR